TVTGTGKPIVLVLLSGSALDVSWAEEHVDAIVQSFYPGQEGGAALAEALFGDVSPGGRLPVTFPASVDDLPPFTDYAMEGRTYPYARKAPLSPFGYGLSYTRFAYRDAAVSRPRLGTSDSVEIAATVENTGARAGDEVVQLYLSDLQASCPVPVHELRGFQ